MHQRIEAVNSLCHAQDAAAGLNKSSTSSQGDCPVPMRQCAGSFTFGFRLEPVIGMEFKAFCDVYSRFHLERQSLITDGWPIDMVLGPREVDLDAVFGDLDCARPNNTVSRWVAEVVLPFDDLGVPERLGLMLLFCRFIRVRHYL